MEEQKKSLFQSLRAAVLPIKTTDNQFVKGAKNIGFGLFFILLSCVSAAIILAMSFAL
jgi:hypothetical protein